MIQLKINNTSIQVAKGTSLLDAAQKVGATIPTLCHKDDLEHFTSCMLCVIKDRQTGKLIPSCTAKAFEGMDILTDDEEIMEARKVALELLLSEHAGDCEAPCRVSCPAFMDIPLMNRLIAAGDHQKALEVVMNDIALPGVMGRICPAPCESACKRKPVDDAVSICLLKRFTADVAFPPPSTKKKPLSGKKAAVIGAGPAGLSAAFYLQSAGIQAVVYDRNPFAGGALQYAVPDEKLEKEVLAKEVSFITDKGVEFVTNTIVDTALFNELYDSFDALLVATGEYNPNMDAWGLNNNGERIWVEKGTRRTSNKKVFAAGNVIRKTKMAISSAAQGKEAARAIEQFLNGKPVEGEKRAFNSTLGPLQPEEYDTYLKEGSSEARQKTSGQSIVGFSSAMAQTEAYRCLHCDCRKPNECKLRDYADQYNISKKRYSYSPRVKVRKIIQEGVIIYEPGKCIKCGICVRITAKYKERLGLTFIGRGFDVEINIPFHDNLQAALQKTSKEVAVACPTGALSMW